MKKVFSILIAVLVVSALAVSAFAAPFIPSVTNLGGPELIVDDDGNVGVIVDGDGNVVEPIPVDAIVITPYAARDFADVSIRQALDKAYANMMAAGSVADLVPAMAGMSVRDLFNVAVSEHIAELLAAGNCMILNFDMQMGEGETLETIAFGGESWTACEGCTTVNADGSASVRMNNPGTYSFVVGE